MDKKAILVALMAIACLSVMSFSYSLQVGYFDSSFGVMLTQGGGNLYISTALSGNQTAFLLSQRLGMKWQIPKNNPIITMIVGGIDTSLLFAFNGTNAILFSVFAEGELKFHNFEITLGFFKGLKAINDSAQFVNFALWSPEVKVGYRW